MTEKEIVEGMLARDNKVTSDFFYSYLMEYDGRRLRQIQDCNTLFGWIKVSATRFFIVYYLCPITPHPSDHEKRIQHYRKLQS